MELSEIQGWRHIYFPSDTDRLANASEDFRGRDGEIPRKPPSFFRWKIFRARE
jgi:hypothetical protein